MNASRPLLAALGVVLAACAALVLTAGADPPSEDPPIGAALSAADRLAVAAEPVERGAPAPGPVGAADPVAVATAFLEAAHTVVPGDAGRTHLRAAGHAEPGSAAAGGVMVLDPPPDGTTRLATVTAIRLVAATDDGARLGYRAELGTVQTPPGDAIETTVRDVVLARQADGLWLVVADAPADGALITNGDPA